MSKYEKSIFMPLVTLMIFCVCGVSFANPLSAEFKSITGTVEIKPSGGNWTLVSSALDTSVLEPLKDGTTISTGFQSGARIEIGSSILELESLTRISFIRLTENDGYEHIEMSITYGRVRGELTPLPGDLCMYKIHSGESSIQISSGIFEADAMNVKVYRGIAVFTGNNNASRLTLTEEGIPPPPLSEKYGNAADQVTPTIAGEGGRASVPLPPSAISK
jgi:hypothetical protein